MSDKMDYTSRDFEALGKELKNYITQRFDNWTDFNEANFGNILKELFQTVGDGLHYYQDKQANNVLLMNTKLRSVVLAIAKRMAYTLATNQPATVEQTFELSQPAPEKVIIPAGEIIKTQEKSNPFVFQLIEDIEIPQGGTSATGVIENSQTREHDEEMEGEPNQEIVLDYGPFIWGSEEVMVDDIPYSRVDDFLDSNDTSRHYVLQVDENDIAHIFFGDGQNAVAPEGGLHIDYKTGGGSDANSIQAEQITKLSRQFTDINGNPVNVTTYNPAQPSGGQDKESIAEAKINIPRHKPAQNRTVSEDDYEDNSREVAGVSRAKCALARDYDTIDNGHVFVYVVPEGGGEASSELLSQVEAHLENDKQHNIGDIVNIVSANYCTQDIIAEIWVEDIYSDKKSDVKNDIIETIEGYFAYENTDGTINEEIDWEKEIAHSELVSIIQNVEGVKKLNLTTPSDGIIPGELKIPALGNMTLYDEDTGSEL